MAEYKRLKQYGLPRSGTNAAKALLEKHLAVGVMATELGNKHMVSELPREEPEVDGVVVSVRDPYAWLWSNWQRTPEAQQARLSPEPYWSEWLRKRCPAQVGGRGWWNFKNPVDRWNTMNWHWLKLGLPTLVVKAEDLLTLEGAEKLVKRAAGLFGLDRREGPVELEDARFTPTAGEDVIVSDEPFDRDYCLNRRYMSLYDTANREHVAAELDGELMAGLRYEVER